MKNSSHLKDMPRDVSIDEDCNLASLDVVALYPSIPVKKALEIVREKLNEDDTLQGRTKLKAFHDFGWEDIYSNRWVSNWKIHLWRDCRDIYELV